MRGFHETSEVAALVLAEMRLRTTELTDSLDCVWVYALVPPGKLLRPTLLVESAVAVGGRADMVLSAAVGAEYGHVASLIHDDIIDGDEFRRGRQSVPFRFGTPSAIIAGNFLIFSLFQALARCRRAGVADDRIVSALEVFSSVGLELCRGEHMELTVASDLACGIEDYLEMAAGKTAALFRGVCAAGAVLGGAPSHRVDALADFGHNLGLAFQICDDVLPYTSDESATGKARSSDVRNRRPTLPVILAYQKASPSRRVRIERIFAGDLAESEAYDELTVLLASTGALAAAHDMAAHHARLAAKSLQLLPPSESKDRLCRLAEFAINRSV